MKKAITPIMICDNTDFYCNRAYARASIPTGGPVTHPGGSSTLLFGWLPQMRQPLSLHQHK